ncbi:unnamed protein product, partial [Penicillium crustosum]
GSDPADVHFDHVLSTDAEICDRIKKPPVPAVSTTPNSPRSWGFHLIISLREDSYLVKDRPFDLSSSFDLCSFSMSKSTLKAVLSNLNLKSEFIEAVGSRRDSAKLSFSLEDVLDSRCLRYIMRTERSLPSDLILAVKSTVDNSHSFTTGFLHGCTEKEAQYIIEWLKKASQALKEPTLMALLLYEIQYERHTHITDGYWRRYNDLFLEIHQKAILLTELSPSTEDKTKIRDLPEIADWLSTIFGMHNKHGRMNRHFCTSQGNLQLLQHLVEQLSQSQTTPPSPVFQTAPSITHRLQQLNAGYKDLEQQALLLKEGTSLFSDTVWSLIAQRDSQIAQRANIINQEIAASSRVVAKASGDDSSAMKALAVLTMVFLPGTALATVLALPVFDWNSHRFWPTTRSSIWIICALAAILTSLVLYLWRYWFLGMIWEKDVANGTNIPYRRLDRLLLRRHDRQKVGILESQSQDSDDEKVFKPNTRVKMSTPILIAHPKPKPASNVPYNLEPGVGLGPLQDEL